MSRKEQVMGDRDHRAWVGPPDYYDRLGAVQFVTLLLLGLREEHFLLDIGCGSLRGGRFPLLYLNSDRYFGIEPEEWCLRQGIEAEVGSALISLKRPKFSFNSDFSASEFNCQFDYIIAAGIFMHASKTQIKTCLTSVSRSLRSHGKFLAAFLAGDSDSTNTDWSYPEVQYYKSSTLNSLAEECGLDLALIDAPHPLGHQWIVLTHAKERQHISHHLSFDAFSWKEYLSFQLLKRGISPKNHEDYLRHDLSMVIHNDDRSVVPQAKFVTQAIKSVAGKN
ncbi:SAM-dependent methyltransferase [Trinickia symbiotica]|uniref:class I SAM-dependent methyltransferase n=1 Tax=Trinickia symbiotica TaxID=863227 RepID=UPI000D4A8A52|nr:class I SAM-dependent methyltransferase [Trinickia symbiotica]PPK46295.1 SAM-dependent methyltransferase [Trinickia symbiotica]